MRSPSWTCIAPCSWARPSDDWGGTVVAVLVPPDFRAVGDVYDDFGQLTDDDVLRVLGR